MGLGARHAWVRGGHGAWAARREAQLPSGPLPRGSPSQPIAKPLYKAGAAGSSFGSVVPAGHRQPLSAQPRQVPPGVGIGEGSRVGPRGCRRLARLRKGPCMSVCSHVLLQASQCVGRLTLCLGVPSTCESPAHAVTRDLCGTGSWGGILEKKGGLTAASCHPLQGVGGLARVHDGLSPELGATSRARCLRITGQGSAGAGTVGALHL